MGMYFKDTRIEIEVNSWKDAHYVEMKRFCAEENMRSGKKSADDRVFVLRVDLDV